MGKPPKPHPLEIRPILGYERRVHATAFTQAVETIMNFDGVTAEEATRRFMADLAAGVIRLRVVAESVAYQYVEGPRG